MKTQEETSYFNFTQVSSGGGLKQLLFFPHLSRNWTKLRNPIQMRSYSYIQTTAIVDCWVYAHAHMARCSAPSL